MRNLCLLALLLLSLNSCANNRHKNVEQNVEQQESAQQAPAEKGKKLGNEAVIMENGSVAHLQDLLNKDGYTLIDCWASWCMPCRRAIPHLKELSSAYADRLKIVSISCDQEENKWRQALAEERMTWPQAIVDAELAQVFMPAYNIQYIPYLMLIKDGYIVVATNDPSEVTAYLKANK